MTASPAPTVLDVALSPEHGAYLTDHAVPLDHAVAAGVRTITTAADLPDGLRWIEAVPGALPALAFPHQGLSGYTVTQVKTAKPVGDGKGYLFPTGVGSVLSVHPAMRDRIDTATRVLIVEGTKQNLAVSAVAPADVLVVGIQGCQGWSTDGVPIPELDRLAVRPDGTKRAVTVWFDADWQTNLNVWTAADKLRTHLLTVGAESVSLVRMGAGQKSGADDYLAKRDDRAGAVARLMDAATPKLGRKPAAKARPNQGAGRDRLIVDWERAQIREPDHERDGVTVPGAVVADFAMRIASSSEVIDELNVNARTGTHNGVDHSLEVAIGVGDTRRVLTVPRFSDEELAGGAGVNPRAGITAALRRLPGGIGTRIWWKAAAADQILAAVRGASVDAPVMVTAMHTGYHERDGVWGYLHNGGFITAAGPTTIARAQLDQGAGLIAYDAADAVGTASLRADVAATLGVIDLLVDPAAWFVLQGALCLALTGAKPGFAPFVHGNPGSGKTTLAWAWQSAVGTALCDRAMYSAESTSTYVSSIGMGAHHAAVVIDDVLKESIPERELPNRLREIDMLSRRAYAGGSAGRGRMRANRTGVGRSYVEEAPDAASPLIVMMGETLPPSSQRSTRERLLAVPVAYESTFKDLGAVEAIRDLSRSGAINRAHGGFIRWIVGKIEAAGGLDAWVAEVEADRRAISRVLAKRFPDTLGAKGTIERAREVPAGAIVGWAAWLDYAVEAGAIDADRKAVLLEQGLVRIATLAAAQLDDLGADCTPHGQLMARIREALQSGTVRWAENIDDDVRTRPVIGRRSVAPSSLEGEHVALMPGAVAEHVLRQTGRGGAAQVRSTLKPVASKLRHSARVLRDSDPVDTLLIAHADWLLDDEGGGADAPVATDGGF